MSKKSKTRLRSGKAPVVAPQSFLRRRFVPVAVVLLAAAGYLGWTVYKASVDPRGGQSAPPPTTNETASATAEIRPEYLRLKGRWQRPDGGYVLEVKGVDHSGVLDAGYFNPNPIHVARAITFLEGTTTKIFVELRDVNYPGSTYTLVYDPAEDVLKGIYFQALEQQSFDVFFVRMK